MYQTEFDGQHHELGTSGFLYRSNKLMYDHETRSLWSTLQGEPVVGPLVDKGISLHRRHVVTTTWGEWKKRHPETTVLSLNTGHRRDYGEGAAYRDYFATHQLMFDIPKLDNRLRNKDEVVGLRNGDQQLAVSARFLESHPVYHDQLGQQDLVILTDASGGNRVYESSDVRFVSRDESTATDSDGHVWQVAEDGLTLDSRRLERLPAHRVFWFGWYAQFPQTRLVK